MLIDEVFDDGTLDLIHSEAVFENCVEIRAAIGGGGCVVADGIVTTSFSTESLDNGREIVVDVRP